MIYEINAERHQFKTVTIEAETPQEAIQRFRAEHPHYAPRDITECVDDPTGWNVIASCEGCEVPILECDDYVSSPDGYYLCPECKAEDLAHWNSLSDQEREEQMLDAEHV